MNSRQLFLLENAVAGWNDQLLAKYWKQHFPTASTLDRQNTIISIQHNEYMGVKDAPDEVIDSRITFLNSFS